MNFLFITNLAEKEIAFFNAMHQFLIKNGHQLFLLIGKDYMSDYENPALNSIPNYRLRGNQISFLCFPDSLKLQYSKPNFDVDYDRLYKLEQEQYENKLISKKAFVKNCNKFIHFTTSIIKSADVVFINHQASALFELTRLVTKQLNIAVFSFERWFAPNSYLFNDQSFWMPSKHLKNQSSPESDKIASTLIDNLKPRYSNSTKQIELPKDYLLILGGDGKSHGYSLRNSTFYKQLSFNSGDETNFLDKLRKSYKGKIVLRLHPYSALSKKDLFNEDIIDGSNFELNNLISNANRVICFPSGLIYFSLSMKKATGIVGHHELEDCIFLTTLKTTTDLENFLNSKSEFNLKDFENKVSELVANRAIIVEQPSTFHNLLSVTKKLESNTARNKQFPSLKKLNKIGIFTTITKRKAMMLLSKLK